MKSLFLFSRFKASGTTTQHNATPPPRMSVDEKDLKDVHPHHAGPQSRGSETMREQQHKSRSLLQRAASFSARDRDAGVHSRTSSETRSNSHDHHPPRPSTPSPETSFPPPSQNQDPSQNNGFGQSSTSNGSHSHDHSPNTSMSQRQIHAPDSDTPPAVPPKDSTPANTKPERQDNSAEDLPDDLPDHVRSAFEQWGLNSPPRRTSVENIKKVAFQSPARTIVNQPSVPDLNDKASGRHGHGSHGSHGGGSSTNPQTNGQAGPRGPHMRTVSSPRRGSRPLSPTKGMRNPSPTRGGTRSSTPTFSRPKVVSRPSSRASGSHPQVQQSHLRKESASSSTSASGLSASQSPTKSTQSSLTPSNASTMSAKSYLPATESWSAAIDDELLANLSPRERARQEVLWEIVHSEERYVQDLIKINETFCKTLLPGKDSESFSLPDPTAFARTLSPTAMSPSPPQGSDGSLPHGLPIAAQFSAGRFRSDSLSREASNPGASAMTGGTGKGEDTSSGVQDSVRTASGSAATHSGASAQAHPSVRAGEAAHPHHASHTNSHHPSPDVHVARQNAYNTLTRGGGSGTQSGPTDKAKTRRNLSGFIAGAVGDRAHKQRASLPGMSSRASRDSRDSSRESRDDHGHGFGLGLGLGRDSANGNHSRVPSRSSVHSVHRNGPVTIPDDLEQVLQVVSGGILDGHVEMVSALRRKYDEQFPLIRSLAKVFTDHASILREYATYILHLERALAQIDQALAVAEMSSSSSTTRRNSRKLEETQLGRLGRLLQNLDEVASHRGEAGLSISLSKPFQRLLKYPLLFQNLLYNTSPSTKEYEATLAMVDEVHEIVRSIEDEKTSNEEKERAHDAWARIDGIERNKQLMAPRPNRLLVSEKNVTQTREDRKMSDKAKAVKERKGHHRISDILKVNKKEELWIVRFTDVSLLCELVGTTSVPIGSGKGQGHRSLKTESMGELSNKRMSDMSTRRHQSIRQRNLYKFVKVHEWHEKKSVVAPVAPQVPIDLRRSTDRLGRPSLLANVDEGPTTPQRTPQAKPTVVVSPDATPTKTIPLKGEDEPRKALTSSRRRPASASGFDDDRSESMSVMSFAFSGEAKPNTAALRGRAALRSGVISQRAGVTKATAASAARASGSTQQSMGQAAANAKFANRLREDNLGMGMNATMRPKSRTRNSLPPAMATGIGRPVSVLSPSTSANTGRETPSSKPPWNASTRPVAVRDASHPPIARRPASMVSSTNLRAKARPASAAAVVGVAGRGSESSGSESKHQKLQMSGTTPADIHALGDDAVANGNGLGLSTNSLGLPDDPATAALIAGGLIAIARREKTISNATATTTGTGSTNASRTTAGTGSERSVGPSGSASAHLNQSGSISISGPSTTGRAAGRRTSSTGSGITAETASSAAKRRQLGGHI